MNILLCIENQSTVDTTEDSICVYTYIYMYCLIFYGITAPRNLVIYINHYLLIHLLFIISKNIYVYIHRVVLSINTLSYFFGTSVQSCLLPS